MHIEANLFISYKHLEASSPKDLEQKMLQIQISYKKPVEFTAPTYNTKTKKYETWFLHNYANDIKPQIKLQMGNK